MEGLLAIEYTIEGCYLEYMMFERAMLVWLGMEDTWY